MFLNNLMKKYIFKKKYTNVVDALYWNTFARKLAGIAVMEVVSVSGSIESNMSTLGMFGFLTISITYVSFLVVAFYHDQTIIRSLFDTKLKQYGDQFEKIATVSFVLYIMIVVGWKNSGDTKFFKLNVYVDKCITDMKIIGVSIDYVKYAVTSLNIVLVHMVLFTMRALSIYGILYGQVGSVPLEKIMQGIYPDVLALVFSTVYSYCMYLWEDKYVQLNTILRHIKDKKLWEQSFFIKIKGSVPQKATQLQDKYVCEKIRMCACLNTKLYEGIEHLNKSYGISLAITLFVCINYIILYMFYFMEATAAGLFHDIHRYMGLLVFVSWQIGYDVFVVLFIVYFAEHISAEARKTAMIVHEIIQKDFSPAVNAEAMQFSLQLIHQVPKLTAHGLYDVNNAILFEIGKYVLQVLVMLLQFVDIK